MNEDSQTASLFVQDVSVSYGKKQIVSHCDVSVGQGETFGLIGLNGVGKTTLIKAVLGLRTPDSGTINISGHDRLDPASKKRLAYLPERFDPPWFLRGREFLKFSVRLYGAAFDQALAEELCRRMALDPAVLANRVQTYSKGMRQKLGLIGTLLTPCPLLILDEPMSGLDPLARASVKEALKLAKAQNRTIFFSSHILADMLEICDRVGVFHGGKLIFTGTPAALLQAGGDNNIERAFLNMIARSPAAEEVVDGQRKAG